MPNNARPESPDLQAVLERRNAWLRAVAEAESSPADTRETPFVRDVVERCRRLQYELAADRYFGRHLSHDH